jgi:catalase (peroxidase I)
LAGTVALEEASGLKYKFCGGRSDSLDGAGSELLKTKNYPNLLDEFKDRTAIMGLTSREMIALTGRIRGGESQIKLGYHGTWMGKAWNNEFFKILIGEKWKVADQKELVSESNNNIYIMKSDQILLYDASLKNILVEFAGDNEMYMNEFREAWTKLMNSDRFDGPFHNICGKIKN